MTGERSRILHDIDAILAAPDPEDAELARIEDILTAGYAHALALEAERSRLERRLGELAARSGDGASEPPSELAAVARGISTAHGDLTHLRAALVALRDLVRAARRDKSPRDPA